MGMNGLSYLGNFLSDAEVEMPFSQRRYISEFRRKSL